MAEVVSSPPAGAGRSRIVAGRYRVERRIAAGGMAEVWQALDLTTNTLVALKVLKPHLSGNATVVERFRREAVAAAALDHPGIVHIYGSVSDGGIEAIVMELVRGRTLRRALDDTGPFPPARVIDIADQVAAALAVAHAAGFVHRDVKPGNILLGPAGRVVVTDFGIAKALSGGHDLTRDDVMVGTAKYLSPEQVTGTTVDGRADLYSLGVVLFELLTGDVPFTGDTDAAIALGRLQRDAPDLRAVRPDVPPALAVLVHDLLQRDPGRRPPSAVALQQRLAKLGDPTPPDPPGGVGTTALPNNVPTPSAPTTNAPTTSTLPPNALPASPAVGPTGLRPAPVDDTPSIPPDAPRLPVRTVPSVRQRVGTVRIVVAGLLTAAILVTAIIALTVAGGDGDGNGGPGTTQATTSTLPPLPTILGLQAFDPPPGDGEENTNDMPKMLDEDLGTSWRTEVYRQPNLSPKSGVGVVLRLSAPVTGSRLLVRSESAGWAARVYVADSIPDTLAEWGEPVAGATEIPGDARFELGSGSGRYVLLWITGLGTRGRDGYFVRIDELSVVR